MNKVRRFRGPAKDVQIAVGTPHNDRPLKLPRLTGYLTLKEKTVIAPATSLAEHLETFYHEVTLVSEKSTASAQRKCKTLMSLLLPRLRGNKFDIQFKDPIYIGSTYDGLEVINSNELEILLPFEPGKVRLDTLDPGYVCVVIPRVKKSSDDQTEDKWRYGRSDDGLHLSPSRTYKSLHKLFERALKHPFEIESVALLPFESDIVDHPCRIVMLVNDKLFVHITPTIIQKDGANTGPGHKPYVVARPYGYDEHPTSDILWRYCYWIRETKIIDTIELADRGNRRKAYKNFKAFIKRDPRLTGIYSYHLKTILLHSLEEDIEWSPRWQRDDVETCFRMMLNSLSECLRKQRLEHFFAEGLNLFENIPEKQLAVLLGRVSFLANNEKEIVRMVKKRQKCDSKVNANLSDDTVSELAF